MCVENIFDGIIEFYNKKYVCNKHVSFWVLESYTIK